MSAQMEIARAAWGDDMPEWIARLADECAGSSQNQVAKRIGRSAAVISNVLRRKYTGDMAAVEDRFKGVFMAETVDCPELGKLPANQCRDWREKARRFSNVNTLRIRMFRACKRCPLNRDEADG